MRTLRSILAAASLLLFTTFAQASTLQIEFDPGGSIEEKIGQFTIVKKTGDKLRINGPCISSCTLFFKTVPRKRVCATDNAVLYFHMFSFIPYTPDGQLDLSREEWKEDYTKFIFGLFYPKSILTWIAKQGGPPKTKDTEKMLQLRPPELFKYVRRCR